MPFGAHFSKLPRNDTGVTRQKAQCRFKLGLAFSPVKTKIVLVRTEVHRKSCHRFIFIYPLPAFIDQRTTQESQSSPPILWVPGIKLRCSGSLEGGVISPNLPAPPPTCFLWCEWWSFFLWGSFFFFNSWVWLSKASFKNASGLYIKETSLPPCGF